MFQDESRFGRISKTLTCWTQKAKRPCVPSQIVREYTYAFAAVSPADGVVDSLVLPYVNGEMMTLFLKEVSHRHPQEHIAMVLDGAAWHNCKDLQIPENISLIPLPPYSPELNPAENFWKVLKQEGGFYNRVFESIEAVENLLAATLKHFEDAPHLVKSIVSYPWTLSALN